MDDKMYTKENEAKAVIYSQINRQLEANKGTQLVFMTHVSCRHSNLNICKDCMCQFNNSKQYKTHSSSAEVFKTFSYKVLVLRFYPSSEYTKNKKIHSSYIEERGSYIEVFNSH